MPTNTTPQRGFGNSDWNAIAAQYPELAGKTAVVTGAAQGLGAQYAEGLVARGVNVLAVDVAEETLRDRVALISETYASEDGSSGRIVADRLDVTDQDAARRVAQSAFDTFGRLDYWINNAGIFPTAAAEDITDDQLARTLGVNVHGALFGAQAAAHIMREHGGGVIINMGSVAANRARLKHADYCAAKAGVEHLTRCLAVEFGPYGIRVNGIGPGDIDTDMLRDLRADEKALESVMSGIPLGRIGSPPEVLGVLLFLLSDGARYVTGHVVSVDGGSRLVR